MTAGPREHFDIKGKWQGYVVSVGEETFTAIIEDAFEQSPDEQVEIYLEEISPDDRPLVVPGARFYWVIGYQDGIGTPAGVPPKLRCSGYLAGPPPICARPKTGQHASSSQWRMPDLATPPRADEVEVSLFGPGFGECVLVHLGSGNWLLVDSCLDQRRRVQPALAYLRRIGHDPVSTVRLIVATHWHDDHIRGLAEVVRTCEGAKFYCSSALREPEVLTVIGTQAAYTQSSGAREFHDVLELLDKRSAGPGSSSPGWTVAERLLFKRRLIDERTESTVLSLSPSDASVTRAVRAIGRLLPKQGDSPRHLPAPSPNDTAVVLWVSIGCTAILLGADLEKTTNPRTGWTCVVNDHESRRPGERAEVFKVAHHGSSNAHDDRVWDGMLTAPPFALLTPFVRGKCSYLLLMTVRGSTRQHPAPTFLRRRLPICGETVGSQRMMTEVTKERHELDGGCGQIRLRKANALERGQNWSVDHLPGLARLPLWPALCSTPHSTAHGQWFSTSSASHRLPLLFLKPRLGILDHCFCIFVLPAFKLVYRLFYPLTCL